MRSENRRIILLILFVLLAILFTTFVFTLIFGDIVI